MVVEMDATFLSDAVKRLENNLKYVENSNMCLKERKNLKRTYQGQILEHKEKLASFFEIE